jgi:hypothetical protein
MSLAGYKGEHGNFTVPEESKLRLHALYMQVTVGDYGKKYKNFMRQDKKCIFRRKFPSQLCRDMENFYR